MKDGNIYEISIWDTAGHENYMTFTSAYYRKADMCIIMYDVNRRSTFESVDKWKKMVRDNTMDVKCILIGNKNDDIEKREIDMEEGEKYGRENGMKFYETNAKDYKYIENIFMSIIEECKDNEGEKKDKMIEINNGYNIGRYCSIL